jgi:hypothetical protein
LNRKQNILTFKILAKSTAIRFNKGKLTNGAKTPQKKDIARYYEVTIVALCHIMARYFCRIILILGMVFGGEK